MPKQANQPSKQYQNVKLYENAFSGEAGKAVLKDLRRTFYDVSCYTPGDAYSTAYMEGQRAVVLYIISKLSQSKHPEMFQEEIVDAYGEE